MEALSHDQLYSPPVRTLDSELRRSETEQLLHPDGPPNPHPPPAGPRGSTFVKDGPKDGQAVVYGGAVPAAAPELVLALLDAQLHTLGHTGHNFDVIATEAQLLGDQAWDGAAEQRLRAQGRVLLAQGQGPAGTQKTVARQAQST